MSCLFFSEIMMDVTRSEGVARCLSGQLLFTCHSLKGTLCAGSSGFPFLVSCTCQSFLFAANMSMICCRNFRRKKIARSSLTSREAKVVQRYGDFLTWQNFCQTFNKVLHSERLPPCGGRAVSRLRVQRYGDFSKRTKFFGDFFRKKLLFLVFSQDT